MNIIQQFLTKEVVEKMAAMEDSLRKSEEYQKKCSDVQHIPNGWLNVTFELQKQVVRSFGFQTEFEIDIALNYLRRGHEIFPDSEICKKRVYVKNNKARQGEMKIGNKYIDVDIWDSKKNETIKLSDILNRSKPVLIFASSHTWQPFRAYIGVLNELYLSFKDEIDMIMIYINEAHATNIWNIGMSAGTINYSHETMDDRVKYIDKFVNTFDIKYPVFADNINLEISFEHIYASWPFRYYIFKDSRLDLIGEPNDSTFDLDPIVEYVTHLN